MRLSREEPVPPNTECGVKGVSDFPGTGEVNLPTFVGYASRASGLIVSFQ
jgi:hypothetical protein